MQLTYSIVSWLIHLSWSDFTNAHHYRIMAMSQTFVYCSIWTTQNLYYDVDKDISGSYIRFKVVAESLENGILGESNEINISYSDIEKFDVTALDGYNGTTLVFRSRWVYDLYRVYNKGILVAETEDPLLELSYNIAKNELSEFDVEWYMIYENKYTLWGISRGIVKIPERKKTNYKISVVIPVYNAQVFLPRTMDSILSSSMSDIEIILVDDGSTDDSLSICKWYAKNFKCVSIIQQSNQRVAKARNNGMRAAKGEYIAFVDNDDIVHPFMYENLYNACKLENVDIAIATTVIRKDINDKEFYLRMPKKKESVVVYTYEDMMKNIHNSNNMYFVAVWNKIVKREVALQVQFPDDYPKNIVSYEDSAYTPTLYSYIDKFVLCKDSYYIWDKRKQKTIGTASTMHKRESADDIWKSFIYAYSYPIYNRCEKHWRLSDFINFKRLIESYDKFKTPSPMLNYWDEKLKELINTQKLYDNDLIMWDNHLKDIVDRLRD